ncbi:MAG: type I DNA topoisomerase [Chitinophagales bacterium]|nr:type I DNA topoisomerase [Chitinophagales bacterium]
MSKNLLIVESPAKAKTIEKILGSDFTVKSCYGHIRDLPKKEFGIDVSNNYQPEYVVADDKKEVVKELKKLSKNAEVWLATDEDREGEAISWHLCEVLDLNPETTKRIVFNEITPPAIKNAVAHPRTLYHNLFYAQQARRVLDRMVGFELSPLLWKKTGKRTLSAGRVQSVAVRLVVEREREINQFETQSYYKVVAYFISDKKVFKAELSKNLSSEKEANDFLEACKTASFKISDIQVKPATKSPSAPFTTSTLQQEASRKLGFSVSKTMMVAQRLYESGQITYMRTDSTSLSAMALDSIESYIKNSYGNSYSDKRQYATKNASAQEAHEAIRPTYIENVNASGSRDEEKLYQLIWKRTIASQMSKAQLERTVATIDLSNRQENFVAKGEMLKFDGFLKVYIESTDDEDEEQEDEGMLPQLSVGQTLAYKNIEARQRFTQAPARFTEASLIKKLEELGIGRPSTYAPTITTILKREYIVKGIKEGDPRNYNQLNLDNKGNLKTETLVENTGSQKGKLVPTDMGLLVTDYLLDNFPKVMDYSFTADIEKDFDLIADGDKNWVAVMDVFYKPFHKEIEVSADKKEFLNAERELGTDPKSGRRVSARIGRYGPMVQIGNTDDEEKPRYAKIPAHLTIETITMEDALILFQLPRTLGEFEGMQVKANTGRFGPYVQFGSTFVSLKKEDDPYTVTLDRAIELYHEKLESIAKRTIHDFGDIQVLNGRWGAFIKKGKENYKIPKGTDAYKMTMEEVMNIIENSAVAPKAKAKKATTKKASTKKATTKKKK